MKKSIEPVPLISREKSNYRCGARLQVRVIDVRVRKLKTADLWLVDELCEPIQGGRGSKAFWQQRGGLTSPMKPFKEYTEKYDSKEKAEDVALKVRALTEAYAHGRILVPNEADFPIGDYSIVIERNSLDNEVQYHTTPTLLDAITDVERSIWSSADSNSTTSITKFRIHAIKGMVQSPPFGRRLDFDAVRVWMDTNLREGLYLVLEETQGHRACYNPVRVEQVDRPTKGRIYCTIPPSYVQSGTFYKTGKHCWAPQGQSRLLPPFEPIWRAAVNRHYFTSFDWGRIEPTGELDGLKLDSKHAELIEGLKRQGSSGLSPFVELAQAIEEIGPNSHPNLKQQGPR